MDYPIRAGWKASGMLRVCDTVFIADGSKVVCGVVAEVFSNIHRIALPGSAGDTGNISLAPNLIKFFL